MKIDLTREPPTDIFRDRGKYLRIIVTLLGVAACGLLLMVYAIVSDTRHSETIEIVVLVLLAGPGAAFVYFGEKLNAYKKLNQKQKEELDELIRKHPEISAYCALVTKAGRPVIFAEYEAIQERAEDPANS